MPLSAHLDGVPTPEPITWRNATIGAVDPKG